MTREEIQHICQPTVKINQDDTEWFETFTMCLKAAQYSKGDLLELLFEFNQAGDENWIAEVVLDDFWTEDKHQELWDSWDGDCDCLGYMIARLI